MNPLLAALVEPNLALNLITVALLLVAVFAVPRAFSSSKQKAELLAKDTIIATREQDNRALRDHQETLTSEVETCRIEVRRATTEAATWRARYEEQSKYTAQEALSTIETLIQNGDSEAQRRHTEVMGALGNISVLVGDRRSTPRRSDDDEPLAAH